MSILAGPYEKDDVKTEGDEDLLMFGYACKLYRDDTKAILENSGQLLIPWMGDNSLMVDRYDVRNRLDDKGQFGLKPNLPRRMTAKEEDEEDNLDRERYLALEWDDIRVEEQEEVEKRKRNNPFNAVSFTYDEPIPAHDSSRDSGSSSSSNYNNSNLQLPGYLPYLPTSTVDCGDEDQFIPPPELILPEGVQIPSTNKLHSIIVKTASFVCKQGTQMEIILKTKQKLNPFFSFLDYRDNLFPYYKHIKEMISCGTYISSSSQNSEEDLDAMEKSKGQLERDGSREIDIGSDKSRKEIKNVRTNIQEEREAVVASSKSDESSQMVGRPERDASPSPGGSADEEESDDDDSDGGGYLHPLLRNTALKATKVSTPERAPSSPSPTTTTNTSSKIPSTTDSKKLSVNELMNLHNSAAFVARSLAINSAPSFSSAAATHGQVTSVDSDAMVAYEYYRQQFYTSSRAPGQEEPYSSDNGAPSSHHHDAHGSHLHQQQLIEVEHNSRHFSPQQYQAPPTLQSHTHHPTPYGNVPPRYIPPELKSIIDKTAEYVAKNSEDFERTVLQRHAGDPRFEFLNPWDSNYAYYQAMKQYSRSVLEQEGVQLGEEDYRTNLQKLSSSGTVSFKLQSKEAQAAGMVTPCQQFGGEESEEVIEVRTPGEEINNEQSLPPPKKQRINGGGEEMGSTVEVFLSKVKNMFGSELNQ